MTMLARSTSPKSAPRPRRYWASLRGEDLLGRLCGKIEQHHTTLAGSKLYDLWFRSSEMYQWGLKYNRIQKVGKRRQCDALFVNDYGSIMRHILVGTTGTRPAMQPRGLNGEWKTRQQTKDAEGLLDYYVIEREGEERQNEQVEQTLAL